MINTSDKGIEKYGSEGTCIVEATADTVDLERRLNAIRHLPGNEFTETLVVCFDSVREVVEASLSSRFQPFRVISLADHEDEHARRVLPQVKTCKLAFLPVGSSFSALLFTALPDDKQSIMILEPDTSQSLPNEKNKTLHSIAWLASTNLLRKLPRLHFPSDWSLIDLECHLRKHKCAVTWPSVRSTAASIGSPVPAGAAPTLNMGSTVLAVIPHYRCQEWLEGCLESLVAQTRQLEGIVVVDDGSAVPPKEIAKRFPQVTLMASAETVGPYCLKQEIIDATGYDAYLLQDADDWSSSSRLQLQLAEAEEKGATIVGSQEIMFYSERREIVPKRYPLDVNADMARGDPSCDPLLHPSCLISGKLMRELSGFATGLRFGGDCEFQTRAFFGARMVNVPYYCYFRRRRPGSLTTSPDTGARSAARADLTQKLRQRSTANKEAVARGELPNLTPYVTANPIELTHLVGPKLTRAWNR